MKPALRSFVIKLQARWRSELRQSVILISFCIALASCSMDKPPFSDATTCVEAECDTDQRRMQDTNWLYRLYYFLTFPFIN